MPFRKSVHLEVKQDAWESSKKKTEKNTILPQEFDSWDIQGNSFRLSVFFFPLTCITGTLDLGQSALSTGVGRKGAQNGKEVLSMCIRERQAAAVQGEMTLGASIKFSASLM